jgi:hypothetical protein
MYRSLVYFLSRLNEQSARSVGFAADTAERTKAVLYDNNCASQGIYIVPLAQETLGGWSTHAAKILSLLEGPHGGPQGAFTRHLLPGPIPRARHRYPADHSSRHHRTIR